MRGVHIVLLTAASFLSAPAAACSCKQSGVVDHVTPPAGSVVPRNAIIRFVVFREVPGAFELVVDGEVWDVEYTTERFGSTWVGTYQTDPFPAGATVSLRLPGSDETVVHSFTVDGSLDREPPTWGGEFTIDSVNEEFVTCGMVTGHWFKWSGMADDRWDPTQLMVIGYPQVDGGEPSFDVGAEAIIEQSMCAEDDPTLEDHLHRDYEIWIEDGAGNRSGPYLISSRGPDAAGCGCATSSPGGSGLLVALGLVAARARRRRTRAG